MQIFNTDVSLQFIYTSATFAIIQFCFFKDSSELRQYYKLKKIVYIIKQIG